MKRWFVAALAALGLGACSISTGDDGPAPAPVSTEGYTLQIVADEGKQIYLVTHSDGRAVAARSEGGASALMDAHEAAERVTARLGVMGEPTDGQVHIRFPGVSISVAENDAAGGDHARVAINADGHEILVDARDHPGADHDDAVVSIPGVNAEHARKFIDDAERLSDEVKTQMKAALGL